MTPSRALGQWRHVPLFSDQLFYEKYQNEGNSNANRATAVDRIVTKIDENK